MTDPQPTDEQVQDLMQRAEAARQEIVQKAAALLDEAYTVLTGPDFNLDPAEAYRHIALQSLEKAVLYINILPEDAKAAVKDIPIISAPVPA